MRHIVLFFTTAVLLAGCGQEAPPTETTQAIQYGPTVEETIEVLRNGNDEERQFAAMQLSCFETKAKDALPAMINALQDPNPFVRAQVAKAMPYVDPLGNEIRAPLSVAARDEHGSVRLQAAIALGKLGSVAETAVAELDVLLTDVYVMVRREAARSLGLIGPGAASALDSLKIIAEIDEDDVLRVMAEEAIKKIDRK